MEQEQEVKGRKSGELGVKEKGRKERRKEEQEENVEE